MPVFFRMLIVKLPAGLTPAQTLAPLSAFQKYLEDAKVLLFQYGARIIIGLITLIIGFWIIGLLIRGLKKLMLLREVDPTLRPFLSAITSIALKILLLLTVASMIGIETTSFVAALGAAGLAVGLALQGSLSNFAGGVLILLFKPFRVGDYILAQGQEGSVQEINILYTTLTTPDNKVVVIPNGVLSNNDIVNFTVNDTRRVDMQIQLAHTANVVKAKQTLLQLVQKHPKVFKEPAPIIGVSQITDNAVVMICQVWAFRADYLAVKQDIYESAIESFQKEGVLLPFHAFEKLVTPRRDNA